MTDNEPADAAGLAELVAWCLTGQSDLLHADQQTEPAKIAKALEVAGWSSARIQTIRDAAIGAGDSWPFVVPSAARGRLGAAQLLAASKVVAAELGISPEVRLRDRGMALDARDRALLADRPPHHG